MVTINTTFHVEEIIDKEFIKYMKSTYLPEAMSNKLMINARLFRIHSQEIEGGQSYSVQFAFTNLDELENWDNNSGKKLNEELVQVFKDKIAGFSTLLEEIEL